MSVKEHYKLFKSGKLWVTALVSVASLGVATSVHAAEATPFPAQLTSQAVNSDQTSSAVNNAQQVKLQNQGQAKQQPVGTAASTVPAPNAGQATSNPATSGHIAAELVTKTISQPQADSTITVANPNDYSVTAAKLVGKNAAGQAYYIYQIVNLNGVKINQEQARLVLAIDPANPQGANYVYVTDDTYRRAYQTVVVNSGTYVDISVNATGAAITNPSRNQIFRVTNTAPFTMNFHGKQISLPASVSIKSTQRVAPVYGLGNQSNINYLNKVDISPENTSPAIEYIYQDKNGNFVTNSNFPANVPVSSLQLLTLITISRSCRVIT